MDLITCNFVIAHRERSISGRLCDVIIREQSPEGRIRLTFRLPAEDPHGDVSVVGSFNNWSPGEHPLLVEDDGTRAASVVVEPGTYHFRYLATGGHWFDDDHADLIDEDGGVLHCHRTDAPIEDHEPSAFEVVEEAEAVLDDAEAQAASTKSSEKGRRQKAGAGR